MRRKKTPNINFIVRMAEAVITHAWRTKKCLLFFIKRRTRAIIGEILERNGTILF